MNKYIVILCFICGLLSYNSYATLATPQAAVLAQQAIPVAAGTVHDIAVISKLVPYTLYFPRGIIKTGFAILPGVTMQGGIRDIGTGLLATTKLAQETLKLPFKAVGRSLNSVARISPLAFAGL